MTITPNNILPGVAPLSFNAGVNIPQSGVYQSLALGQQMMQWPLEMRYKENQLELQKQNMELNKQQIQQQLQRFEFEKQQYNDTAEKELETLRGNTFKVVDSLFGMEFYNEKDKARFEQLANESGLSQKEIAGMLQTGDNVQLRDTNKKMLALMSNPEVRKIMQKDGAIRTLQDAYTKNPKNFNPHAVSQAIRTAYDEDVDFNPRDFAPANFVNKTSPIDDLKTKYEGFSNVPPDMRPLVMEEFMRDYETYTGQSPYVMDEAGQVVTADNGSPTLSPEAMSAYEYATGGAKFSDGELLSMIMPFEDDPEMQEMYAATYRAIEQSQGSKSAQAFLGEIRTAGIKRRATEQAEQSRLELEQEKTDRALKVQELKNAGKDRGDLYKEGLSQFLTPKSSAMLLATNLYDTWGIELGTAEDAAELQDILKANKSNIGKSMDAYLENMYGDDVIGAMSKEELAKAINVPKYDDIVYLPETNKIEYTKGDKVVQRDADALKEKPEYMAKVKAMARADKKERDDAFAKAQSSRIQAGVSSIDSVAGRNNNPLNMRDTKGKFIKYNNLAEGFEAGVDRVQNSIIAGKSKSYPNNMKVRGRLKDGEDYTEVMTIADLIEGWSPRNKYGGDNSDATVNSYLKTVEQSIDVPINTLLKDLEREELEQVMIAMAGVEDGAVQAELLSLMEAKNNNAFPPSMVEFSERVKKEQAAKKGTSKAPTTAPSQSGKQVEVIKRWGL